MNLSAPLGALCAALIGAIATLLGLLISKENKTSEFRQEWINKLRDEITLFLVSVNAIRDATHVEYTDISTKLSILSPLYADLNEAAFKISLRLNPDELEGQAVLRALHDIQSLVSDEDQLISGDIRVLESELLIKSKLLLKTEWKRVKQGEPVFRGVRRAALFLSPLLLLAVVVAVTLSLQGPTANESAEAAVNDQTTLEKKAPVEAISPIADATASQEPLSSPSELPNAAEKSKTKSVPVQRN